jgi:hypothetical protein
MKLVLWCFAFFPTALAAGLLAVLSDCQPPKKVNPKFSTFSINPAEVCTNLGIPVVRGSWQVTDPSKVGSCVRLSVNGTLIVSQDGGALPGNHNQLCNSTDTNWSGEFGFSMRDVFGNNMPSSFTVEGVLEDDITVNAHRTVFDQRSASGTTKSCEAGFTPH